MSSSSGAQAVAIVEAKTRLDVCAATARALLHSLFARASFVALASTTDSERGVELVTVEGEHTRFAPVGTWLTKGPEVDALGRSGAQWSQLAPAALRQTGGEVVIVPIGGQGVAVAILDEHPEPSTLEAATLIGATANAALHHVKALDEGVALTRRLQALLELQRALASGVLEDSFSIFASRLSGEIAFDVGWVGVLPSPASGRLHAFELEVIAAHGDESAAPIAGSVITLGDDPISANLRNAQSRSAGPSFLGLDAAGAMLPGAKSGVIVPLVVHDALVGVLVLLSRRPHLARLSLPDALPDARWLLSAIAEPVAMALQNASLVSRLRSTMRDWQTTFDVMDSMVLVADEFGTLRRANWALARRLSTTPSALVGRAVASLFPGQTLPSVGERTSFSGNQGEPLRGSGVALPGGGTVIVIHDARAAAPGIPSQSYAALRRVSTQSQALRGHVLIVDDEPSILRAVSRTLGRSHEVSTATDGDEALEMIRREPLRYDAVMTDVQMPRMNGVDLYRAIEREFPSIAERVLFMTGGVFATDVEQFLRSVKQRVLRKPFDPDLLRRAIDERVALSRVA